MVSKKSRQKSSSISSIDSGLGYAVEKKLTSKSVMNRQVNSSKQYQEANLTAKTRTLKGGLKNSSEKFQGLPRKLSPLKKENLSDFKSIITSSKFSPLACSTQQVKKSESTSESSGEEEFSTERTIRVKRNSSSDFEADSSTINEVKVECTPISKSKFKSKSKINIIENQLIPSDSKDEVDSDGLSVVAVNKLVSSYSVSSEIDSEEERPELQSKTEKRNIKSLKPNKTRTCIAVHKNLQEDENRSFISSNSEIDQPTSLDLKSRLNNSFEVNTNDSDNDSESIDVSYGKSRVRTTAADEKSMKALQKQAADRPDEVSNSQQHNISSTDSDSSEKKSSNEGDSYVTIERKLQHKKLDEVHIISKFLNEDEGYEKLAVSKNADLADLDSDDEVYLLQIPKSINPKIMEGVTFSLSKKSKLKTVSGKYIIKRQSDCTSSFLTYTNSLKIMTPLATYRMEKNLKAKGQDEFVVEETNRQPMPNNIKVRHPLFGSDYKSKIQLEDQIKEKLEQALQRFNLKRKTPKRKKKIKEDEEDKSLLISKILEEKFGNISESFTENKHVESFFRGENPKTGMDLKSTIKTEELDASYSSNLLVNEMKSKRKKKKKHFSQTQDLELSNKIEHSFINLDAIKKENCELEEDTSIKNDIQFKMGNREKRKKNRNVTSELIGSLSVNEISKESSNRKKAEKMRHKKFEALEEKLEIGNDMEFPLKKIKKSDEFEIKMEISNHDQLESNEILRKKKKKKKKNLEYTMEELSVKEEPYEAYPAQSPKRKKKSILSSTRIFENLDVSDFKVDVSKIDA